MSADQTNQVSQFPKQGTGIKLLAGDKEAILYAGYIRRMEKHLLIGGYVSEKFAISVSDAKSGQIAAGEICFAKTESDSVKPGLDLPWRFMACIALEDSATCALKIAWPKIQKDFLLAADILSYNLAGIDKYVFVSCVWPILRYLKPYSNDWHKFAASLPPQILAESSEDDLSLEEQEAHAALMEILPQFDASDWICMFDTFSDMRLTGWIKRISSNDSQAADLYLKDKIIQTDMPAKAFRADVREAGFGTGRYGFDISVANAFGCPLVFNAREPETGRIIGFRFFDRVLDDSDCIATIETYYPALRGYCYASGRPERILDFNIYIDDVFFATAQNDKKREDLKKRNITSGLGGFSLDSPLGLMEKGPHSVSLEFFGGRVSKSFKFESPGHEPQPLRNLECLERKTCIVIPFYNDPSFSDCLRSLFAWTPLTARIIIVDDCSPDVHARDILAQFSPDHHVTLLENSRNLGFSATVNRGMSEAGEADVILLNQDARVTRGWFRSLLLASTTAENVATVTPMSDSAGAFSAPERGNYNPLPSGCSENAYARAFRRASFSLHPSVPTCHGFCTYIRRKCLDEIGMIDAETFSSLYGDENDFSMRALRAGWLHLVDDATYVFHDRPARFSPERKAMMERGVAVVEERYPEYRNAVNIFRKGKNLNFARFASRLAAKNWQELAKPRLMFVMAVSDGGTPQTNLDLMREFENIAQCYLLECDTFVMRLHVLRNGALQNLYEHRLKEQLEPVSHISGEYDAVAASWIKKLDIDLVHIRQIIWHSLNLASIAKELGCRVVFSFHDFYAVSSNLNLIDDAGQFRGDDYIEQSSPYRVNIWHRAALGELPVHDAGFRQFWKERMWKCLRDCDAYVTTSGASRDIIMEEFPHLDGQKFKIIPHGRNFRGMKNYKGNPESGPARIVVPGNINCHKGRAFIEALAEYDRLHADCLEFHILGRWYGRAHANIRQRGEYQREDFAVRIAEISPRAGLMFSIWSETWCHTITEMWSCGIPVFSFNIGTQAERIKESGAGWLLEMDDIPQIYAQMLAILNDPAEQEQAARNVASWQTRQGIAGSTRYMAQEYYALYHDLLNGRAPVEKNKLPLVAVCTKAGLGTSHLRLLEPCKNDFKREISYLPVTPQQLEACASLGLIDAAIIQRNLLPKSMTEKTISLLRQKGIPYLYELDDDLYNIPLDKDREQFYKNYKDCLDKIIAGATGLMVSTAELKNRYAEKHRNIAVVPSRLGCVLWSGEPVRNQRNGIIRALYQGTYTHMEDLKMILPALEEVAARHPHFRLAILGIGDDAAKLREKYSFIEVVPLDNEQQPYPAYVRYLRNIAPNMDFSIAPLKDTFFNNAKSSIKVIEYAALGLPAIASDVGPYKTLTDFPHLILCTNDVPAWIEALSYKINRGIKNYDDGIESWKYVIQKHLWCEDNYYNFDSHIYSLLKKNYNIKK